MSATSVGVSENKLHKGEDVRRFVKENYKFTESPVNITAEDIRVTCHMLIFYSVKTLSEDIRAIKFNKGF